MKGETILANIGVAVIHRRQKMKYGRIGAKRGLLESL
jgi:hypothetical protein